jgi:hypothetical protein
MVCKLFGVVLKVGGVAFLLFVLLFSHGNGSASAHIIGSVFGELTAVFRDAGTQCMVFLCLEIYFISFLVMRWRSDNGFPSSRRGTATIYWLVYPLGLSAGLYALHYSTSAPALTLLAGVVLGQGAAFWVQLEAGGIGGRSPEADPIF